MRLEAVGKRYGLRQPWIIRDVTSGDGASLHSAAWPTGLPLAAALVLVGAAWTASCWLAGRRGE